VSFLRPEAYDIFEDLLIAEARCSFAVAIEGRAWRTPANPVGTAGRKDDAAHKVKNESTQTSRK
jgi:hypothetical protein